MHLADSSRVEYWHKLLRDRFKDDYAGYDCNEQYRYYTYYVLERPMQHFLRVLCELDP